MVYDTYMKTYISLLHDSIMYFNLEIQNKNSSYILTWIFLEMCVTLFMLGMKWEDRYWQSIDNNEYIKQIYIWEFAFIYLYIHILVSQLHSTNWKVEWKQHIKN